MTPPYFSSTSHNRFFLSSSVHRSAHENIKIRQYMFTQEFLFNYITSAKSSISDPFSIVGQYHLLINCFLGLVYSIRFWAFCTTYSISFPVTNGLLYTINISASFLHFYALWYLDILRYTFLSFSGSHWLTVHLLHFRFILTDIFYDLRL